MRAVLQRHRSQAMAAWKNLRAQEFLNRLTALEADVLISVAFPHRIPEEVTDLFRCGGVNLHPALLPEYRGPHPIHVMVLDGALARCAGVTLHRISSGFDEGDIIAQTAADETELQHPERHSLWFTRLAGSLAANELPQFCRKQRSAFAQPSGTWRYARLMHADLEITDSMRVDDIFIRSQALGTTGKLRLLLDGKSYKVAGVAAPPAQPTRQPPRITWSKVEFDAADGRIALYRAGHLERRLKTFAELMVLRRVAQTENFQT